MNKNQKKVPYSFSKIVYGHKIVRSFHSKNVDRINAAIKKAQSKGQDTSELKENLKYQHSQIEYFNTEIERLSLTKRVCGDPTVLIK